MLGCQNKCGFSLGRAYGAPSYSSAQREEFRRSRLFKVTERLIGMLMIYGGTGGGERGLTFRPRFSWGQGLVNAMPLPLLYGEIKKKEIAQFSRGFWTLWGTK